MRKKQLFLGFSEDIIPALMECKEDGYTKVDVFLDGEDVNWVFTTQLRYNIPEGMRMSVVNNKLFVTIEQ